MKCSEEQRADGHFLQVTAKISFFFGALAEKKKVILKGKLEKIRGSVSSFQENLGHKFSSTKNKKLKIYDQDFLGMKKVVRAQDFTSLTLKKWLTLKTNGLFSLDWENST